MKENSHQLKKNWYLHRIKLKLHYCDIIERILIQFKYWCLKYDNKHILRVSDSAKALTCQKHSLKNHHGVGYNFSYQIYGICKGKTY